MISCKKGKCIDDDQELQFLDDCRGCSDADLIERELLMEQI